MLSGTTRESEQVTTTAYGCCPSSLVSLLLDGETSPDPFSDTRNLLFPSFSLSRACPAGIPFACFMQDGSRRSYKYPSSGD